MRLSGRTSEGAGVWGRAPIKQLEGIRKVPRVRRGTTRHDRRKKILKLAEGYYLAKSKLYRYAKEAVDRA